MDALGLRDEWQKLSLNCDDAIDESRARRALSELYQLRGSDGPSCYLTVDSPRLARLASFLLRILFGLPGQRFRQVDNRFWVGSRGMAQFLNGLHQEISRPIRALTLRAALAAFSESELRPVWNLVWHQLLRQLGLPLYRQLKFLRQTWWERLIPAAVHRETPDPWWDPWDDDYPWQFEGGVQVRGHRARRGSRRYGGRIHWRRSVGSSEARPLTGWPVLTHGNNHLDFAGLGSSNPGFLACGPGIEGVQITLPEWRSVAQLARAGVWDCILHDRCAVLIRRPKALRRDPAGRLHCDNGPAFEWRDGFKGYAVHQVLMPEWVFTTPDLLNAERIRTEPNLEVRRAMVEIYGRQRFLTEDGAVEIDRDVDGAGMPRRLFAMAEVGQYVEVSCPSTQRVYLLQVPPSMQSCQQAVAWTFGLEPQHYTPLQEA